MTPEDLLHAARATLDTASRVVEVAPVLAAREAYMAAFHAAEALILARTGHRPKTHKGVNIGFANLVRDMPEPYRRFASLLAGGYDIKQHYDYLTGSASENIGENEARETMAAVATMIDAIAELLAHPDES